MEIPCGSCTQCRIDKARERTIRCVNEASMHEDNCFITLTYDGEHLPKDKNLNWEHFKEFMKRLRSHIWKYEKKRIKYFACGEYGGDLTNKNNVWFWDRSNYKEAERLKGIPLPTIPRAHYHAIIFGWYPDDSEPIRQNRLGDIIYTSEVMRKKWKKGHVSHGEVTPESCGYVARYVMKKQNSNDQVEWIAKYGQEVFDLETGELICVHPTQREMAYGSSQPAIGATWLKKYWKSCFANGFIMGPPPKHQKYPIPRYYWEWLERHHYEEYKIYQKLKTEKFLQKKPAIEADNTYERRESKDFIINEKAKKLKRNL